jgi:putative protease
MATRKKVKGKGKSKGKTKTRAKAKKAPARKPAALGKAAKKAPGRRTPPKAKKPAARRAAAKPAPAAPAVKPPPGERIGIVTHYFNHLSVAVVKVESGSLRVGDNIHFRGHTTDFGQRVESLQVNHAPVASVEPEDDFGQKVREHVREHDVVYKVA